MRRRNHRREMIEHAQNHGCDGSGEINFAFPGGIDDFWLYCDGCKNCQPQDFEEGA